MKKNILIIILLLTVAYPAIAQTKLNLIPQPQAYQFNEGSFKINDQTVIYCDEDDKNFKRAADYLAAEIKKKIGLTITVKPDTVSDYTNGISFGGERAAKEHYVLDITSKDIQVATWTSQGAFYAAVTILQLLDVNAHTIPCGCIVDEPRFKWRGLMLDCSRTFQSIDYIKKTIDLMAMYKMNVLHLHLTDDQGWRIEIKKYPELTQKGATFPAKYNEPAGNDGYYTQQQMKALIKYASERNITIVPEIELPGHSIAPLACYPELSCTGGPFEIYPFFKGPNITPDIYCAGNEKTFEFLQNVLDEVFEIFPSQIVHVGGDEAPKSRWQKCPKCQKRIKDQGLKDEHELQSYFIKRIEKYANSKDKRIIGWDEILEGGLAPNAAVMFWRNWKKGGAVQTAVQDGHDVVMSPTSHCYFDYTYERISTERAYSFEPIPDNLPKDKHRHILGLQANFWSHIDRTPDLVDRQLWPRLLAIAERGWSPKDTRDFDDFNRRVTANLKKLRDHGVTYKREQNRKTLGQWSPDTVTEEYAPITFDATTHITKAGDYRLLFQYTNGACRLGIEKVELLEDGQAASFDTHRGVTGGSHKDNIYTLKLTKHNPNSKYQIRAYVRSEGGKDSNGKVYFISQLYDDVDNITKSRMQVNLDAATGQYIFVDGDKPVLQYNYATIKPEEEYLKKVHPNNLKYAVPRSNYIHPLYGPQGEEITYDWSNDHPHHRGIYWAWPEVQYQGKTYDLHALQNVFARPTGKVKTHNGNDFAEIQAENRWLWDDKTPIVLENTTIRTWPADKKGRYIDLTYMFTPLVDGVTLARRGTNAYGGLNIRMSPIKDMKLINHTDSADTKVRAAWQSAVGIWKGGTKSAVFAVFEKAKNPEYPADYVEYPNLPWYQPTFPKSGNRYLLNKDAPWVLKHRLWIRSGDAPTEEEYRKEWNKYQKAK